MIPEGWRETRLEDLASIRRGAGSQYLTYVDRPEDGIRLIRIGDFHGNDPVYVERSRHIERFILTAGDILIAGTGATAGIVFEVPDEFDGLAFSYNAPLIQISDQMSKRYIYYVLTSTLVKRQQEALFTGNAQPFLDTKAIGGFKISLPPREERCRIADIFETWDRAIETVEALIVGARAQKQALMQQLLPQGATPTQKRLPGFSGEWKETTLADILSVKRAKGKIVPTNEDGIGVPYIGSTSFLGEFSNYTDASAALLCGKEDILVLWDGEYAGKVTTGLEGAVSSTVARYRLAKGDADPIFVVSVLENATERIRSIREGSGIPHMPGDFEHWFKFALPCFGEQSAIAHAFKANRLVANQLETQLAALRREKAALMQQLLTGKRRVRLPEGEEA